MATPLSSRLWLERLLPTTRKEAGAILLSHRRIYILPNRRGLGLLLLLALQLLASINYNNNLGFILTFLLGSIGLLGALHSFRNLAGLRVRCGQPEPVFVGEAARLSVFIDNPTSTPRVALHIGLRQGAAKSLNLEPGESLGVDLTVEARQRGWLALPGLRLDSSFPLGLYRAWAPLRFDRDFLAYPRPAADSLPLPLGAGGEGEGGQATGGGDDFYGFQSYQPGDPLRRIHWKGVAKGQGVHVKEYQSSGTRQIDLDWQKTPGQDGERRLSRLCRWLLDAEQTGASYGLRLPGTEIQAGSGLAHLRQCLEALAIFKV